MARATCWLWLLALATPIAPAHAELGPLDALVMPGKVINGHATLEGECKNCHVPFKRADQRDLCLGCHDHRAVAQDVAQRRGYHGRLDDATCSRCHTEHKGREADIVKLDPTRFDHAATDFPLRGGHAAPKVQCRDCHQPGAKHRAAPSDCYSCHRKDDKHKGGLGKDCVNCHVESDWKQVRFDHSKTGYRLEGKHLTAECTACHVNHRYKDTPKDCYSCHRKDDDRKGHKGRFGTKCQSCHTASDWKTLRFDHDRDTRYPLLARHRSVKCVACHTGTLYVQKLASTCVSCHTKDDKHKGQFGRKCESCHTERDWRQITFDHTRHTRYPLRGKHGEVKCSACHTGNLYQQKLDTTCYACHRKDDKHKGQEGNRCEQCHDERSWTKAAFDHGLARFPLLGKHAQVPCKNCHETPAFKDAPSKCSACHQKDDAHKRRLGAACEQCHNARNWKQWDFDHNRRTRFVLDGGHERLACHACHKRPAAERPTLSSTCVSCHDGDDVHAGAFGRQCEQCHVTATFREIVRRPRPPAPGR